jgi:hypothetical protein
VPTTVVGLVLAVVLLIPGSLHYVQRRSRVPQRSLSPLVETATMVTVSTATNLVTLGVFAILRTFASDHTPDVRRAFIERWDYNGPRLGYIAGWSVGLLALSCVLAVVLGVRPRWMGRFSERFTPAIVDVSAWYHVFEEGPKDNYVHVGCDLRDGSWVSGLLDWYSTDIDETGDRDFVLAEPILFRPPDDTTDRELHGFSRLVLSARDVMRMYVTYLDRLPPSVHEAEAAVSS